MSPHGKILIVEDEAPTLDVLQRLLVNEGWTVETAADGETGLTRARSFRPDVILSDLALPGINGFELCHRIKADPETASALFVILTVHTDTALKVEGLRLGVDDYLTKPPETPELLAKAYAMLRIKRLHDELRNEKQALQLMQQRLTESFNRLLSVLLYVLDLRVPGAAARGEQLASWAIKVAERFEIPEPFVEDLRLAALLHEIGRVVDPSLSQKDSMRTPAGFPHDWAYTVASKAIMQRVERLQGAAALVSAVYENWDGTGMPHRWQKGQIPLRSRILRVTIDFFSALAKNEPAHPSQHAMNELTRYSGTRYDPVVLQHLIAVIKNTTELPLVDSKYQVVFSELEDGMVLAEDLRSASGIKLLAAGCAITPGIRELVHKRDHADPIIDAAWVSLKTSLIALSSVISPAGVLVA